MTADYFQTYKSWGIRREKSLKEDNSLTVSLQDTDVRDKPPERWRPADDPSETTWKFVHDFHYGSRIQDNTYQEFQRVRKLATADILSGLVEARRDVCSGVLVLIGTRIPVSHILAELGDGQTIFDIAEDLTIDRNRLRSLMDALSSAFGFPVANEQIPIRRMHQLPDDCE